MANDSSKPRLVIIEGKDKGKVITIEPGTTVFGRTKGDVILQDPRVSRSHLSLTYEERSGKLSYSDLKSLNGCLVNGAASEAGILVDGDKLQIGNTLFDCQLSPSTELAELKTPGKPLAEESFAQYTGSAAHKIEPVLLDELDEPSLTNAANAKAQTKKVERKNNSLFAKYQALPKNRKNILLGVVGATLLYWVASGSKNSPPADFHQELALMQQLEKAGKFQEAIAKGETLAKEYDKDAELFVTLGGLYTAEKRLEPAIQAYLKAKTLVPNHPVATVRLTASYLRAGMAKEAEGPLRDLDKLMKDGNHSKEFFIEAANLFLEFRQLTQSPEKALILSRALQTELATESTVGFKLEAQLMFQQNQPEQAVKAIEQGLKRDPQDEWLLENLAFARLSLKDTLGAEQVVESWIQAHPNTTKALLVMSYLKYNEKNYLGALPPLQKIVQISNATSGDPHVAEALNLMAQIYQQQGQLTEAKNLFTQACDAGYTQACSVELPREPQSSKAP